MRERSAHVLQNAATIRRHDRARSQTTRRAVVLAHRNLGREHPETLTTPSNLALAIDAQGRFAEPEAILGEVLPLQEKVLGRERPETLRTRSNLALAIHAQGRAAEAEDMLAETVTVLRRALGDGHTDTKAAEASLAQIRGGRDGG